MEKPSIRVLLVEDDEDDYIITDELLSDITRVNYDLEWVTTYQDALPLMAACEHDIYLVDYRLGPHNGLDLTRAAIESGCKIPIILLTGQGGMEVDLEAMETGVADYLAKGKLDSQILERSIRYAIERNREQENLRKSEERYRTLFESSQDGIVVLDQNENVVSINPAGARMMGYDKATELIGLPSVNFYMDPNQRTRLLEELMEKGTVSAYELTLKHRDGFPFYVLASIAIHLNEDGEIQRLDGVFTDITERKRTEQAIQKQLQEQLALNTIAVVGSKANSEDDLVRNVTESVAQLLYSDHFGVLLLDEELGVLRVHPSYRGVSMKDLQLTFPLGESIVGQVAISGQTKKIDDTSQEPAYYSPETTMASELCVPLKIGERVFGVINAESRNLNAFSGDDTRLLETIAGYLATAIDRIRNEEAERQQRVLAEALRDTAEKLNSTLDINEILDHVLDNVDRVVPHDAANIMLIEGSQARVVSQRGYAEYGIEHWIKNSKHDISTIPNWSGIVKTLQPDLVPDTSEDSTWVSFPETSWIKSYVAVPIQRNDIAIGVISLDSETPHFFNKEHAKRLQIFADQVSVSLENASLYQDALQAAERRLTLHEISQEVVAASRSPEQVYEAIHKAAAKLMSCEAFSITTTNGKEGRLEAVYLYDKGTRYPPKYIDEESSFSGTIIKSGKSVIINDLEEVSEITTTRFGHDERARSVLATPMQLNGKAFGMIATSSYHPHAYSEEDKRLLEMLAAYAATTLESARLFDETQQHAQNQETLNMITRTALATEDYDTAMQILADRLKDLLEADMCFITAWDEERKEALPGAASGVEANDYLSLRVDPGEVTLTASVLESGQTIAISDVHNSPYISQRIAAKFSANSMLGLPLKADGKKLGAALIAYDQLHEFMPKEIALGENAAAQISLALAKIQLLDETHQRAAELEAVADVSEALRIATTRAEMPPIILDQIINLLDIDGAFLANIENETGDVVIDFVSGDLHESGMRIPAGEGITGHVIKTGRPYITKDAQNDPLFYRTVVNRPPYAMAVVPLITQDQVVGTLAVSRNVFD